MNHRVTRRLAKLPCWGIHEIRILGVIRVLYEIREYLGRIREPRGRYVKCCVLHGDRNLLLIELIDFDCMISRNVAIYLFNSEAENLSQKIMIFWQVVKLTMIK